MSTELWLAYCGYLLWLGVGLGDFICHRRTDLPYTSGVAESATHLIQLALLAMAVVIALAYQLGRTSALLLSALVLAHAAVGYIDTRIAFARHRVLLPAEQHIHSVLDMAPVIGLAWIVISTWPAAIDAGWQLDARRPALPRAAWVAALIPPVLLCVLPALLEFRAAWRARKVRP
jgi:hypothetical protein